MVVDQGNKDNLVGMFSLKDIKDIVLCLVHNKSLGPDGFLGEFYHFSRIL
jgi:hypothetical protein